MSKKKSPAKTSIPVKPSVSVNPETPQIVLLGALGGTGAHNQNLHASVKRLEKSAVWKKQRVVVILPAGKSISTKVALSHWALIFPPNQAVMRMAAIGVEVGAAYSHAIESVLAHPELSTWEYILTIEHDNIPPQDGLLKLIERMESNPKMSCIGGSIGLRVKPGYLKFGATLKIPFRTTAPRYHALVSCRSVVGLGWGSISGELICSRTLV